MALTYAGGPHEIEHGKPASAFSKGDLLCFNSGSSLSQCDNLFAAGTIIAGVALSMSTESVSGKVPYIVAKPETRFWITAAVGDAGAAQRGTTSDLSIEATYGFELLASTNSAVALVRSESSTDETIVQRDKESANSWVIISIVSTTLGVGSGSG